MKVQRRFTTQGQDPFATVEWTTRTSRISNPDGSVVFEMTDAEVPAQWSQLATDIMVSKYFRKAGVPQEATKRPPPARGQARDGATTGKDQKAGKMPAPRNQDAESTGPERSARQVIHRLAGCWRHWGETHDYFDTPDDAQAFYDEIVYMMLHQMCAPNSPQWFNTGLAWAYGLTGPAQGHWVCDPQTGEAKLAPDAYTHPQPHACFIQSIDDDLVSPGGIMDLWTREARLFKYGSGTGTNFSNLRGEGEALSGGGKSSGLMSWLRIGDRAAAAVKSGGTTRRAAKMVCLDMDHPDIRDFINWKVREEIKVAALVEGLDLLTREDETVRDAAERLDLKLEYDFNGEAYQTVSGQNSNNSVRIPDAFFDALDAGESWETTWRTTGEVARVYEATALWDDICFAAWRCADPGVQFDTTINDWHTCPSAGRINASNPCSEYLFVDNTACNLASLNVLKFFDVERRMFDVEAFEHAIDLWTIVLEISVLMASFPSREIAELSYRYRTLGLGYANLGAMLMQAGIPYDSDEGRATCACISAILTGRAYRQSAQMASQLGAFPGYDDDKENMLRVIRNHRLAAHGEKRGSDRYERLRTHPVPIDHALIEQNDMRLANTRAILRHAARAWDEAYTLGTTHGYRNAQVTVIAPTGTIGLLMDCDTTGVEPDFALMKFKKLAGGGYFKIANASVRPALANLGYAEGEVRDMLVYLLGTLDLDVDLPPGVKGAKDGQTFATWLRAKGLSEADCDSIKDSLPGVFELSFAFSPHALGAEALGRLGIDAPTVASGLDVLCALGLTPAHVEHLHRVVCGAQTLEGAPHMRSDDLPVFDCANTCGAIGTRFIEAAGHIRMMAAAQPFISGAISKTINLPGDASVGDIASCYRLSWELGLKANALYRDGCKRSQPLNSRADTSHKNDAATQEADEPAVETNVHSAAPATERAPAEGMLTAREVKIVHKPLRRRLPDTRRSITHKFSIASHEGYLTVGLYDDGKPGELFITMAKEGSTVGGLMDSIGTAVSVALQYGVPLESLVRKFTHQRFEPSGMTANKDIPFAKSLVDYIFRWLGMEFLDGYRQENAPQREADADNGHEAPSNGHTPDPGDRVQRHTNGNSAGTPARGGSGNGEGRMTRAATLSASLESMGDAPACDVCGTITVRSGTCYKCLNCGNSMGCS